MKMMNENMNEKMNENMNDNDWINYYRGAGVYPMCGLHLLILLLWLAIHGFAKRICY